VVMRTHLSAFQYAQVFLNYPFDAEFEPLAHAMHFAVVAAGLVPLCAHDLSVPDRPRLEMLVDAIMNCHYSAHDFSRSRGEGSGNFARFNMPIEMGMALFHALQTQRQEHRCAFFVASPHDHQIFASDLAGLDPKYYGKDETELVASVFEWLRAVARPYANMDIPTGQVKNKYTHFKKEMERIKGNGNDGRPNHDEAQELMYMICSECLWWDWRANRLGMMEFPSVPLDWKE